MTKDELFKLSAEKAAKELSRENIDFLFQPLTLAELLLRVDLEGTIEKYGSYIDSRLIDLERFYRQILDYQTT